MQGLQSHREISSHRESTWSCKPWSSSQHQPWQLSRGLSAPGYLSPSTLVHIHSFFNTHGSVANPPKAELQRECIDSCAETAVSILPPLLAPSTSVHCPVLVTHQRPGVGAHVHTAHLSTNTLFPAPFPLHSSAACKTAVPMPLRKLLGFMTDPEPFLKGQTE